jgi:hypothetical protein
VFKGFAVLFAQAGTYYACSHTEGNDARGIIPAGFFCLKGATTWQLRAR